MVGSGFSRGQAVAGFHEYLAVAAHRNYIRSVDSPSLLKPARSISPLQSVLIPTQLNKNGYGVAQTGSTSKMQYAGMACVKVQERWSPGATAGNGKI